MQYKRPYTASDKHPVTKKWSGHMRLEANLLEFVTKNNLRSSRRGLLIIVHTLSEEINFSKCTIGDQKYSLGKSILYEVQHRIGDNI